MLEEKMPGYKVEIVSDSGASDKQGINRENLHCAHCHLVLREPLQLEDGTRICKSCFEDHEGQNGYGQYG